MSINMKIPLIFLSVGALLTGLFAGEIMEFVNSKIIAVLL